MNWFTDTVQYFKVQYMTDSLQILNWLTDTKVEQFKVQYSSNSSQYFTTDWNWFASKIEQFKVQYSS